MSTWTDYRPHRKPKPLPKMHYRAATKADATGPACGSTAAPAQTLVLDHLYRVDGCTTVLDQVTCVKCLNSLAWRLAAQDATKATIAETGTK